MKELPIIVKADVQGSRRGREADALRRSPTRRSASRVIHAGCRCYQQVRCHAGQRVQCHHHRLQCPSRPRCQGGWPSGTDVEMRMYRVIYDAINDDHRRHEGHAGSQVPRGGSGPCRGASGLQDLQRRHRCRLPRCRRARSPAMPRSCAWCATASSSREDAIASLQPLQGRREGSGRGLRVRHRRLPSSQRHQGGRRVRVPS